MNHCNERIAPEDLEYIGPKHWCEACHECEMCGKSECEFDLDYDMHTPTPDYAEYYCNSCYVANLVQKENK